MLDAKDDQLVQARQAGDANFIRHLSGSSQGYIYVEAEREDYVRKALQGMRHVYHSKPIRLVPINEMVDSISVAKKEVSVVKQDSWVRMRTGVYKGDLAQVVDVNYADNQCTVKLLPRIDYQHLADKESGAQGKPKSSIDRRRACSPKPKPSA